MGWKTGSQEENEMDTDNEAEVSEMSCDWKLELHDSEKNYFGTFWFFAIYIVI